MEVTKVFILQPDTRWGTWSTSGPGSTSSEKKSLVTTDSKLSGAG